MLLLKTRLSAASEDDSDCLPISFKPFQNICENRGQQHGEGCRCRCFDGFHGDRCEFTAGKRCLHITLIAFSEIIINK